MCICDQRMATGLLVVGCCRRPAGNGTGDTELSRGRPVPAWVPGSSGGAPAPCGAPARVAQPRPHPRPCHDLDPAIVFDHDGALPSPARTRRENLGTGPTGDREEGDTMEPMPEDWERAVAVVAHPDDLEYGAAAAVARWTGQGKHVAYVLATRGEAGIEGMAPDVVGPLRVEEERRSAALVGVSEVDFLDHADGLVEYGIPLRRDLAAALRRHKPDVVITM